MTEKFTKKQREQLKRLVLECVLSRFTTVEALQYINEKLHISISRRYYFLVKRRMTNDTHKQLAHFTKNKDAYLHEFYQRILEIEFLQKKMWELYDNNEKDPEFRLDCIKELRMLTMTLVDLYKILPGISGFEFQYESDNNQSVLLREDNRINWTDAEEEAFDDEANDSGEAKF
jgi:hypothetical protein